MIIKKIDIENFGKFTGFSVDFAKGFNVIKGNNEDGKTTLMAFIKLMFYGTSSVKSSDISKNIRKKYTPWNGAPMSGAIEFEINGNDFRLHKELKKSASSDKTTVTNLTTGEKYEIPGNEEPGKHFFDMDQGEFERSVFIETYGGFSSDASADSLAMRISNLSASGDENFSQSVVSARIAAAKEELVSKSGKKGLLVGATEKLEKLKYNLEVLRTQNAEQQELQTRINALKKEISQIEKSLENHALSQKIATAQKDLAVFSALAEKYDTRQKVSAKIKALSLSPEELASTIAEGQKLKTSCQECYCTTNTENQIAIPDSDFNRLVETEKNISALDADINRINSSVRRAREVYDQSVYAFWKKSKLFSWFSLGLSVAGLITTIITFLLCSTIIPAVSLLTFSVICLVSFFALLRHAKHNAERSMQVRLAKQDYENQLRLLSSYNDGFLQKSIDEIFDECNLKKQECINIITKTAEYYGCSTMEELSKKTVSARNYEYAQMNTTLNELRVRFITTISKIKPVATFEEANSLLSETESLFNELKAVEHDIVTLSKTIVTGAISPDFVNSQLKALTDFLQKSPVSTELTVENPDLLSSALRQKRDLLGELQSRINYPEASESDILAQISELSATRDELTKRYESLNIAQTALDAASSEMSKGLGSLLSQKTGEYLSRMTNGKYSDVLVSRNLSVETRSALNEGYHEWKYLSSGAIDRVYLALRLAATDIIAEKHNPLPLFLDDILAQYDEENCRSTVGFLKDYYENTGSVSQILLFTCHNHISDIIAKTVPEPTEIRLGT